jgi:serine-type D-Ala-D-Ala carboxypeptidase/endopeptidase
MVPKIRFWISLIAGAVTMHAAETPRATNPPNENEIRNLLADRIKALGGEQGGIGIVVGMIAPEGRRIISAGRRRSDDPHVPDGDTVFEIGSVTKAFGAAAC